MKPVDYRNETFADIKARLHADMQRVLDAWRQFGPGATCEVSEASGIPILTFRPRSTDLFDLGYLVLLEGDDLAAFLSTAPQPRPRGGVYRATSEFEARGLFEAAKRDALREQKLLSI